MRSKEAFAYSRSTGYFCSVAASTVRVSGSSKRPDPPLIRRAGTCHPSLQGAKPVKRRFFLFWRHGCSAARNSPACKGKSLRCLRKCRFAYIDTSPALSARRHLTAALRPSRLHLGCQSHQISCASGLLGAVACSARPIQNFLPGTTVAIVGVVWAHGTPQGDGGTECEAARCGRAGCKGAGRLRCDLAAPTRNRPSGLSSSLSRRRASRCRHRRTCCRSGQNQTSADGTLQQAIAHTRTCQFTATSRVRSCL